MSQITEYTSHLALVRAELYNVYRDADNSNAKLGALREINRSILEEIKVKQGAGILPAETDEGGRDEYWRGELETIFTWIARKNPEQLAELRDWLIKSKGAF